MWDSNSWFDLGLFLFSSALFDINLLLSSGSRGSAGASPSCHGTKAGRHPGKFITGPESELILRIQTKLGLKCVSQ